MNNKGYSADFINRESFIELDARERAKALFDEGTSRELVGPFDRVESPWLAMQGVTPQEDDGCVVMKGKIGGASSSGRCARRRLSRRQHRRGVRRKDDRRSRSGLR